MALDSKNNIKSVFVIPDQEYPTIAKMYPGTDVGGVAVTNVSNEVLDATTVLDYTDIKIVKDRGASLPLQQVRINLNDVVFYSGQPYAAATEQVSYVGYDGTTGSMDSTADNFFIVKLEHVPNSFIYGKRPASYKYGTYQSGSSTSQVLVATGLVKSLVQNFKANRNTDWRVFAELTNAGARTAATATGAVTLTFTKYSKRVTATDATASTNIVAGDYVAIDALTTTGVYKVTAKDGSGNLTLDIPYQGETTTITAATNNIRIVEATANAANFGIKITGIKQKYDVNKWRQYDKVRFNVLLENFSATINVNTTAPYEGLGVYEQVANDEYISWGDEGQVFVDQVPPQFREQDADSSGTYSPLIVSWVNKLPSLIGAGENKGTVILYFDAYVQPSGDDIPQILDAWLAQKGFAAQVANLQ